MGGELKKICGVTESPVKHTKGVLKQYKFNHDVQQPLRQSRRTTRRMRRQIYSSLVHCEVLAEAA